MNSMSHIKVSICVITYNQKNYVRECLESLVNQQADFKFEIIVGDDASSDGTKEIIQEYAEIYPNLIFPILHRKNIGTTKNYLSVHHSAKGDYICHIDGDDIAFPNKIKKQADFLDQNLKHVVSWHTMEVFNDLRTLKRNSTPLLKDVVDISDITQSDLLRYGPLGIHSSTMYRRSCIFKYPDNNKEVLDYMVFVFFLKYGKAAILPDILGGYRYNITYKTASKSGSFFKNKTSKFLYLDCLKEFQECYGHAKKDIFNNALFNFLVDAKHLRLSAFGFLNLALKLISFNLIINFLSHAKKANKLKLL